MLLSIMAGNGVQLSAMVAVTLGGSGRIMSKLFLISSAQYLLCLVSSLHRIEGHWLLS